MIPMSRGTGFGAPRDGTGLRRPNQDPLDESGPMGQSRDLQTKPGSRRTNQGLRDGSRDGGRIRSRGTAQGRAGRTRAPKTQTVGNLGPEGWSLQDGSGPVVFRA